MATRRPHVRVPDVVQPRLVDAPVVGPCARPATDVSVTLEIVDPPTVPHLYFWALQVGFVERSGRRVGGAHLGLQWHPRHPGSTAVNWGGYRDGAGELDGDESSLPSALQNKNTRDFDWRANTPYRLRVHGDGDGWWTGEVTDLTTDTTTVVRRLHGGGTRLADPVVWSEVFARCDDPPVTVRWSEPDPPWTTLRPTYQSLANGGCTNSRSAPVNDGDGAWLQRTNVERDR